MLRRAQRMLSHDTACLGVQCCVTACSANAVLHSGMLSECCLARDVLGKCYIALRRARRGLSCVKACLSSGVSCYSVLGECSIALRHAYRVQYCVTVCLASAALRYGMISE